MQPINTLFGARDAAGAAVNRLAFALLRWSPRAPILPGLYGWRCGVEGPECVSVGSELRADGAFGLLLNVRFEGRSMSLVEVLGAYPESEWAKVNRGGKHEVS